MPQLQQLWEEFQGKGLHVFAAECQGADKAKLEEWLAKRNVTFPNTVGRGAFGGYQGQEGLPYAFVVGVDGKVIWEGRQGYKKVIHDEIKKVRYPGLGKVTVAKDLEKAAALFAAGKYAEAAEEAEEAIGDADEDGDSDVAADAQFIIARVADMKSKLQEKFERYKGEREFTMALAALQQISRGFKGTPEGDTAKATLKELEKDKTIRNELKADAVLANLQKSFGTMSDVEKKKALLDGFIKKFDGTKAAERAQRQLGWF